jgi:preprotein translocase subunit SecG
VSILVTVIHVFVCFVLIMVVLLQAGKGANMGAAFGGSSQTIFGSSGPGTFLGKMTTVVASIFLLTALSLSYFSVHKPATMMDKPIPQKQQQVPASAPAPAVPAAAAPAQTPAAPQK